MSRLRGRSKKVLTIGGLENLGIVMSLIDLVATLMYFLHTDTVWFIEFVVGGISIERDMLGWTMVLI